MLDAVVIGGGPAGYVAAIRLAQLGLSTVIVEKERLGGECLNWGCIPSKAIIELANTYTRLGLLRNFGIDVRADVFDIGKISSWKDDILRRLSLGIEELLRFNGAELLKGNAKIASDGRVKVTNDGQQRVLEARYVVIATGAEQAGLGAVPFDGKRILGFKDFFNIRKIPSSLLIIGGGASGLEIGMAYRKLGVEVAIVEVMDRVIPYMDREISTIIQRKLLRDGIRLLLSSSVLACKKGPDYVESIIRTPKGEERIMSEYVLVAIGKRASPIAGLEGTGIALDRNGFVSVDSHMRSSNPNFYAAGDVTGPPFLAHKAYRQGIVAAESIAGLNSIYDPSKVPVAIFTDPEVASIGFTEEEAKAKGYEAYSARLSLSSIGRSLISGDREGLVKIVAERGSKLILGIHIVGPHASELISWASLLLALGGDLEQAYKAIHPHPTFSEALSEALAEALGRPIHKAHHIHGRDR